MDDAPAGVASPMGYSFWMDMDASKASRFRLTVSGNYLDIVTPVLRTALQLENELKAEEQFLMLSATVAEAAFWDIAFQ